MTFIVLRIISSHEMDVFMRRNLQALIRCVALSEIASSSDLRGKIIYKRWFVFLCQQLALKKLAVLILAVE